MKRDEVLVGGVRAIATGGRRKTTSAKAGSRGSKLTVTFTGGGVGVLDSSDAREKAWAEVLESLRSTRQPAYVELDSTTRRIKNLLIPHVSLVLDVREAIRAGDLQVELEKSHAVHFLRRDNGRFAELRALLEEAVRSRRTMLVTDSLDGASIIDVRPSS